MQNASFEKSCTKCRGTTVWNGIKFVLIVCPSRGIPKCIDNV